ncbi:hypothetical protein B9Z55_005766 [Caenorhabditis nigoni]|uniref:RecF/RecN/SMC N-terminal domain-containing protein n=1 Tax=Caenorhabditis nigoni TaxID=1611254 RepID=A0A2G5V2A9_9PELO|nr:hypothetical protein B9Z55_005766 [Caenorhabditis nigoni]
MHIKSIQLDGFKSYQKHTEIAPFSPQFNAITGYNGSGKSNVLDSICFLLGISKLDNIRAKSMNELISHGGSKAIVQIRFDNRDKKQSPFGMDHLDELVVQRHITALPTGKSCYTGYTLNGHSATTQRMIDFFRGVGLNVNNPHFLIMQGRITTVLNMKPEEILGMVEEAAGTKMYDQKRKEAEKTLFLKEAKLKEIDRIFEGSIDPRMDKLREDRKNMVEVTRLQKLRDNAQRKLGAFEYHQSLELSKREMEHMEVVSNEVQELNQRMEQVVVEIGNKGDEQQNLIALRDNPAMETDLSLENKTKQEASLKLEQEKRGVEEGIVRLKSEIERTIKRIENDEKALGTKQVELENIKNDKGEDIDSHEENKALITKLRGELEGMSRGTVTNDKGEHVSLETYIQETRAQAADLDTKVKTANNRRDRIQANLNRAMDKLASLAAKSGTDQTALAELTKAVEKITQQVQSLGYNADEDVQRREREKEITDRIRDLKRTNDNILNNVCGGRYAMNFVDPPVPWFNYERDVEGLVLHLIRLKPQYKDYAMAVDIALSGSVSFFFFISSQLYLYNTIKATGEKEKVRYRSERVE